MKEAAQGSLYQVTSQYEQIGRHDRSAHGAGKRRKASPGATPQSEDAFEERYDALNSGPEVAQASVNSPARGHILDRESPFFREGHIFH